MKIPYFSIETIDIHTLCVALLKTMEYISIVLEMNNNSFFDVIKCNTTDQTEVLQGDQWPDTNWKPYEFKLTLLYLNYVYIPVRFP